MHKLLDRIIKSVQRNIEKIGVNVLAILFFLILARIVLVILYYNGIPPNLFHAIGLTPNICSDQFEYFRIAQSFSKFEFTEMIYPIGLPLLLVPFIYIFHANTLADIFMPVSVFNSIFLYSASILLIYGIANRITGNNKISLLASTLWVLLPYKLSSMWWVYVLSDPPMIFVVLLAIYLYLRGKESMNLKYPFFVGMLTAFGVIFRIPGALFVLFFALMYGFERKFKHCIMFLASTLIFHIPQFMYNSIAYHSVIKTGYSTVTSTPRFSINYVVPFFDRIIQNNWLYSLFGLLIFSTIGILYLFIVCKDKFKVFFLASWLYLFLVGYMVVSGSCGGIGRHIMPVYPAVVICIAGFVLIGFISAKAILLDLFKGEKKDAKKFIIVLIPVLFLLFASIAPTNILSECHTINLENAENEAMEYSGWYTSSTGLWLKPNTSGVLMYEIETKEYPYVYLSLSFYNPGVNRLEISTDDGRTYNMILKNKNIRGHRLNITEYIKDKPSFILRFSAHNSGTTEKMVIRTIYICNLRYTQLSSADWEKKAHKF